MRSKNPELMEKIKAFAEDYHTFVEKDTDKISFIADGITPLRIVENNRAVQRVFPKGTVVLEQYLLSKREDGRRRFTLTHEASHYITDRTVAAAFAEFQSAGEEIYTEALRVIAAAWDR